MSGAHVEGFLARGVQPRNVVNAPGTKNRGVCEIKFQSSWNDTNGLYGGSQNTRCAGKETEITQCLLVEFLQQLKGQSARDF